MYLDHCSITDDGMNDLAASIMSLHAMDTPPSNLRILRFHGNQATEDGLKAMGLALQMAKIKIDKLMPKEARRHYDEMSQMDEKQRSRQRKTVKRHLDDPGARRKLVNCQREICRLAAQLMFLTGEDDDGEESDDGENAKQDENGEEKKQKVFKRKSTHEMLDLKTKMNRSSTRNKLKQYQKKIQQIVAEEVKRIARLTEDRTEYYQIAGIRWKLLEDISMDNRATAPHIQPHGFGSTLNCSLSLFRCLSVN